LRRLSRGALVPEVHTRSEMPTDWAMTQNNLGNALSSLGERESDTVRLEEAIAAFQAALEVRTRSEMPRNWAMTQIGRRRRTQRGRTARRSAQQAAQPCPLARPCGDSSATTPP
jgi:Tetratricopeptide repeat